MRLVLPLLAAAAFRLRNRVVKKADAVPVHVLQMDATVEYIDYVSLAKHDDLQEFTSVAVQEYLVDYVCSAGDATALLHMLSRAENATNGTNGTNDTAEVVAEEPPCTSAVVRLFGNPFHIHAEFPYSPQAEAALKDPSLPKRLSNYLLTVPSALLYANAPPICEHVSVTSLNVTSVIPECHVHLAHLMKEFRAAYTNRMVPWALDAACGSFSTTLSFATTNKPSGPDQAFCETATKHLMNHHYSGVDFYSREEPAEKDYEEWCVKVCEYRHGPTAVCAVADNATNATATDATANATSLAAANALHSHAKFVRASRVMGTMHRMD
jgi:hypothetical protein